MPAWHALPPEINSLRLITGAGPAPMIARAEAYSAIATAAAAQEAEVVSSMGVLSATSEGLAASAVQAAHIPYIGWLQYLTATMTEAAGRSMSQASAHGEAVAMTPPLPEIAANRAADVSLQAANIATGGALTGAVLANEAAYMAMWAQAAAAMDIYSGQTVANVPVAATQNAQSITSGGQSAAGAASASSGGAAVSSVLSTASQAASSILQPALQMISSAASMMSGGSASSSAGGRFEALMSSLSGRLGAGTDIPNVGFGGADFASALIAPGLAGGGASTYGAGVTAARGSIPTAPSFTLPASWSTPSSVAGDAPTAVGASGTGSAASVPVAAQAAVGAPPPLVPRTGVTQNESIEIRATRLSPLVEFATADESPVATRAITPTDPAPTLETETS
jgi:PPE-repeat protein